MDDLDQPPDRSQRVDTDLYAASPLRQWCAPAELFASAFEAFVEERLLDDRCSNIELVHGRLAQPKTQPGYQSVADRAVPQPAFSRLFRALPAYLGLSS